MNIGAAAKASGVTAKMIRYYESIGLIPSARRSEGGYRVYDEGDIASLRFIRHARLLGFPMPDLAKLLALWHDGHRACAEVKQVALAQIDALDRKIEHMEALRATLRQLADRCPGDAHPDCSILDALASPLASEYDPARPPDLT